MPKEFNYLHEVYNLLAVLGHQQWLPLINVRDIF